MSLGDLRKPIRRVISTENEFTAKRVLRRFRSGPETPLNVLVHAGVWKTASQWIRLVLTDPRLYDFHDLLPASTQDLGSERRKALYTPYFGHPDDLPGRIRGKVGYLVVVREPASQFVSWYVSTRYTHVPTKGVLQIRQEMEGMSDLQGAFYFLENYFGEIAEIYNGWNSISLRSEIEFLDFDQLRENPADALEVTLSQLGWRIDRERLQRVCDFYHRDKLEPRFTASPSKYQSRELAPTVRAHDWSTEIVTRYDGVFEDYESMRSQAYSEVH